MSNAVCAAKYLVSFFINKMDLAATVTENRSHLLASRCVAKCGRGHRGGSRESNHS